MIKKSFLMLVVFFLSLTLITQVKAQVNPLGVETKAAEEAQAETQVEAQYDAQIIHLFASKTCPHCLDEKEFLTEFKRENPGLKIYVYEIAYAQNSQLLSEVAYALNASAGGVPFTVIGKEFTVGFSAATEGKIRQMLDNQVRLNETDLVTAVIKEANLVPIIEEIKLTTALKKSEAPVAASPEKKEGDRTFTRLNENEIELPIFGKIHLKQISLPLLTVMLGFLDGFNPCAMWVLMFLISLLLGIKDRKRMWILGFSFIAASALVYFLFMAAWLNLFLFIGLVAWVRILIAALAIGVGIYYLRDYVKNKDGACQVDLGGRKQRIFARLKKVTYRDNLAWALLGIVLLAFAVNLLELLCSAGLPAIYTQVLAASNLSGLQHYLYLLFYIFFFMLDDLVVFVLAMISLKAVGLDSKYARLAHLLGGILMLFIGLAMIFKPELIMFN